MPLPFDTQFHFPHRKIKAPELVFSEGVAEFGQAFFEQGVANGHEGVMAKHRSIGTRFGTIALERIRYEPCDADLGLTSLFPLEMRLGIVSGKATLALADRFGQWSAQHMQETVHRLLQEEHHVSWSVTTIRKIVADLSAELAPLAHSAKVEHVRQLLQQAHDSTGPHRPVLTVGRDGIFVPLCQDTKYRETARRFAQEHAVEPDFQRVRLAGS